MDRASVQAWLDRYVAAWKTYDADQVASLFAPDATYRYHPWDEGDQVVTGRDAIVRAWIAPDDNESGRDAPNTYDASYEPYAVEGDRAVAVGWSRYWTDTGRTTVRQIYDNVFLMRFDGDGRCVEFTELFMKRPDGT
jgi:ketosteroid isomerase-like protein